MVDTSAPNAESLMRLAQDIYRSDSPAGQRSAPPQAESPLLGGSGTREFVFVAVRPGRAELALARPWEDQEMKAFSASVRIGPGPPLRRLCRTAGPCARRPRRGGLSSARLDC
jgi:hypothetical protein